MLHHSYPPHCEVSSNTILKRLQSEIEQKNNPNIGRISRELGKLKLFLELITGRDLHQHINFKPSHTEWTFEQARNIAKQSVICCGEQGKARHNLLLNCVGLFKPKPLEECVIKERDVCNLGVSNILHFLKRIGLENASNKATRIGDTVNC